MNIRPQPKGFGIRAPRVLKRILDVAGIKDVHVTVRNKGNINSMAQINCILRAMQEIESPQEKASRTGYHIVRINPQKSDRPKIIASPNTSRMNIDEKRKPFPLEAKYMNQKLFLDFFNYSYSGLHRKSYNQNKYHNLIRFGRTGSHCVGHMEYYQMPRFIQDVKRGIIPPNFIGTEIENDREAFIFDELPTVETSVLSSLIEPQSSFSLTSSEGFGAL